VPDRKRLLKCSVAAFPGRSLSPRSCSEITWGISLSLWFLSIVVMAAPRWVERSMPAEGKQDSISCTAPGGSTVDKLVCSDKVLAVFAKELAVLYSAKLRLASPATRVALVADQESWKRSNALCADTRCLRTSYAARINDLLDPPVPEGIPLPSLESIPRAMEGPLGGGRRSESQPVQDYAADDGVCAG